MLDGIRHQAEGLPFAITSAPPGVGSENRNILLRPVGRLNLILIGHTEVFGVVDLTDHRRIACVILALLEEFTLFPFDVDVPQVLRRLLLEQVDTVTDRTFSDGICIKERISPDSTDSA